jgi:hypothetical protein
MLQRTEGLPFPHVASSLHIQIAVIPPVLWSQLIPAT